MGIYKIEVIFEECREAETPQKQTRTNRKNQQKKQPENIMASHTKVTARQQAINWQEVRKYDQESYDTFHTDDGELSTLALLRGIHNIQVAGGDGAAEQPVLDRVGFKPLSEESSARANGGDDAVAAGRANMTLSEAEEWARELDAEVIPSPPAFSRVGALPSPQSPPSSLPVPVPGAYDAATRREVAQLTEVVADLDVPGAPPSITLPEAFVSEEAFSAHVEGRVREAVDEACVAFECERQEWARTEAAYRRELLSENRLLEAVLRKYNVSIADAKAALVELDAADPIVAEVSSATTPLSPATALPAPAPIERDSNYVRFTTMATRGRRPPRSRGGAGCAP